MHCNGIKVKQKLRIPEIASKIKEHSFPIPTTMTSGIGLLYKFWVDLGGKFLYDGNR